VEEVQLRPAGDADMAFLALVYASTRAQELAAFPWSDEQRAGFIAHQVDAQMRHYRAHYEGATYEVIEVAGEPAGRLFVHRGSRDIRVMDIALLPAFRGRGIGGRLLADLREEAAATGRRLSIHVEVNNPARRLYERIGMRVVAEATPPYLRMEWAAPDGAAA
jgi:ribosomal protein S18 acetylase RimI-like enzyme